jgi:hypothetical protein
MKSSYSTRHIIRLQYRWYARSNEPGYNLCLISCSSCPLLAMVSTSHCSHPM